MSHPLNCTARNNSNFKTTGH